MEPTNESAEIVTRIFADRIDEPTLAMRSEISRDELWELSDDIKANGLINPITVRPKGERYEVVAGHRRFLACRMAGVLQIPCVVRDVKDEQLLGIMASENLARANVDPVDEAIFIGRMMQEKGMTAAQIAETVRRSQRWVEDRMIVGTMPDYMHRFLKSGEMKLGVALELVHIEPDEKRRIWVGLAVQDNITVRTAQYWRYQYTIGTLPEITPASADENMPPDAPPRTPMFTCAIDGTEHPTTEMRVITFAAEHMETIRALSSEIRSQLAAAAIPPAGIPGPGAGAVAPAE